MPRALIILFPVLTGLLSTDCLTQRTVTKVGGTVSQEYAIKPPVKKAVVNCQYFNSLGSP